MKFLTIDKRNTTFSQAFLNVMILIALIYQEIINIVFAFNLPFPFLLPFDFITVTSVFIVFYYIINHFNDELDFNKLRTKYKFLYHYTLLGIELNMLTILICLIINLKTNTLSFLFNEYQCITDLISLIFLANIRNIMIHKANAKMPIRNWFKRILRSLFVNKSSKLSSNKGAA